MIVFRAPATPGMLNLIGHIVEKEHLRGLWKGMIPVSQC
jgi:hypothetical protein